METDKVGKEEITSAPMEEIPAGQDNVPSGQGDIPTGQPESPEEQPESPAGQSEVIYQEENAAVQEKVVDKKSFLRACASWTDIFVIAAMLSVLMLIFGDILSSLLDRTVIPAYQIGMNLLGDADSVSFLLQYFNFYGIWIAFILVTLLFKGNWPMWKAFLYNGHGNNLKAIPAGILLGFGMNGFCILMSVIMGDIKLSYSGFDPKVFFVFLLCVMIQSGAEEIVDRCYLYQKLRRRYRWPAIAVLVNSLVFMALHMGNPGVTKLGLLQVFLIGVLFSLIVYYWDSLWTVIWAHTAWNFSQSIVFDLPNSGIVSKFSVFKLEAASARDGIYYQTTFGVEGSMGANAIIAGVIVIVLIYGLVTKRGEMADHWEEMERRDTGKNHIWEAVVLTVIMAAIIGLFALGGLWLRDHSDEVQQFLQEVQEEQAIQQEQEGQQPGQGTTPDQSQQPGQEVTPDQSQQPGQETTPDQSEQPGQEVTPDQNAQPGQDGGQTQEMQPQNT